MENQQQPQGQNQNPGQGQPTLRFIPLGGMGEVTKNMYVYETQNDIVVVDCGIGFPPEDEAKSENELLIPDFSYLLANQKKVRGRVITHGHEDHIGAIPYLLKKLNLPVYAARLPLGFIREKLKERGPKKVDLREVHDRERIKLGRGFSFGLF